jgi:hypothetical protein
LLGALGPGQSCGHKQSGLTERRARCISFKEIGYQR